VSAPTSTADAVVAIPRRSWESAIAEAIRRFASRNAAFSRFASKLRCGSNGKGQVRFLSAPAVSWMKASIASTATREAISPATWPPMPSATTKSPTSGRVE
jgi:hypothetical protein